VAALYGIKIYNLRDPGTNKVVAQPVLKTLPDDQGKSASLVVDGLAQFTGMMVEGVRAERCSKEQFVGRRTDSDLMGACRTLADSKVIRALTATGKVPIALLKEHGMAVERCTKGSGYGSSTERGATRVAEEGVKELAAALRDDILSRTGGDESAAKELLMEVTKNEKAKFPGFNSTSRMTKKWQVEGAMEKLKKHPTFGDAENIE